MLKTLILYWSATGNTAKVAETIAETLRQKGLAPDVLKISEKTAVELLEYDLVFTGAPPYQFLPPDPVLAFVKRQMKLHNERGDIQPGAPTREGKTAVIFCTYSGPHTGLNEVISTGEYLGQMYEHLGFKVAGKWYTVGEFHNRPDMSLKGRLGDIRGRPNAEDLREITVKTQTLLETL